MWVDFTLSNFEKKGTVLWKINTYYIRFDVDSCLVLLCFVYSLLFYITFVLYFSLFNLEIEKKVQENRSTAANDSFCFMDMPLIQTQLKCIWKIIYRKSKLIKKTRNNSYKLYNHRQANNYCTAVGSNWLAMHFDVIHTFFSGYAEGFLNSGCYRILIKRKKRKMLEIMAVNILQKWQDGDGGT